MNNQNHASYRNDLNVLLPNLHNYLNQYCSNPKNHKNLLLKPTIPINKLKTNNKNIFYSKFSILKRNPPVPWIPSKMTNNSDPNPEQNTTNTNNHNYPNANYYLHIHTDHPINNINKHQ